MNHLMSWKWLVLIVLADLLAPAKADPPRPNLGHVVRHDARIDQLIPPEAAIEVLASGFDWSEGPVWVPRDGGFLLFSDIPNNSIMRWSADNGITLFLRPSGYTGVSDYGSEPGSNGLGLGPEGELICCEHGDRRVSRMTWDGGKRTIVDHYQGRRFNSPNDHVWSSRGDLYFTDPPYGLPRRAEDPLRELDFCGVYRVGADGKLALLTKDMSRPNGIALSPDENTLYVANSDPKAAIWMSFPVLGNGTLGEGKLFYDATSMVESHRGLPDGMAIDRNGNLFATGPGGVLVFSPDGKLLGRIDTGQATANCCFGGPQSDMLFITADSYLCRLQTSTSGHGLHHERE